MKKYLSIALIAVMGLLAWSCSDDNIVAVYNPEGVTPQTLDDVTGVTLTPDGAPVNFTSTPSRSSPSPRLTLTRRHRSSPSPSSRPT